MGRRTSECWPPPLPTWEAETLQPMFTFVFEEALFVWEKDHWLEIEAPMVLLQKEKGPLTAMQKNEWAKFAFSSNRGEKRKEPELRKVCQRKTSKDFKGEKKMVWMRGLWEEKKKWLRERLQSFAEQGTMSTLLGLCCEIWVKPTVLSNISRE